MKTEHQERTLNELIPRLPEVYQPIFGHPEFQADASRPCSDRLESITCIYKSLSNILGRPLRVLDLGCAQGFFSFNLAALGATVQGVDFLPQNIELCDTLARENKNLDVSFVSQRVEERISSLKEGEYDIALGLSVFHHIIHEHGIESVKELITKLAHTTGALILEFALKDEPLFWASSQPSDPKYLVSNIPFVHTLGEFQTHLCEVERPLLFASTKFWALGKHAGTYDHWTDSSHALENGIHLGTRRYFFSENQLVKIFTLTSEKKHHNIEEINKEAKALKVLPPSIPHPSLITHGRNSREAWLVRELIPGKLLLDHIGGQKANDPKELLKKILAQLSELENNNLYHNDLRSWNILIDNEENIFIIDYGAISSEKTDCDWPYNPYLSALILAQEIAIGFVQPPQPVRALALSPFNVAKPFSNLAKSFWELPQEQWSFAKMLEFLDKPEEGTPVHPDSPGELQQKLLESALQKVTRHIQESEKITQRTIHSQQERVAILEMENHHIKSNLEEARLALKRLKTLESISLEILESINQKTIVHEKEARDAENLVRDLEYKNQLLERQIETFISSTSWKVTAPLRKISRVLRAHGESHTLHKLANATKRALHPAVVFLLDKTLKQATLRHRLNTIIKKHPAIHRKLISIAINSGLLARQQQPAIEIGRLSPKAEMIYQKLVTALGNQPDAETRVHKDGE